jgi:hypothetical protein
MLCKLVKSVREVIAVKAKTMNCHLEDAQIGTHLHNQRIIIGLRWIEAGVRDRPYPDDLTATEPFWR